MTTNKQTWEIGKENASDIIATLEGTTLTISGKGEMKDFSVWHEIDEENEMYFCFADSDFTGLLYTDGTSSEDDFRIEKAKIADLAPWSKEFISNVHIDGVNSIGECAFRNLYGLKSVIISESVQEIGSGAFWNCRALESIKIPKNIQRINGETFRGCRALKTIEIPENVQYIDLRVFRGCFNLESVVCHSRTLPTLSSDTFFDDKKQEEKEAFKKVKLYVPAAFIDYYKNAPDWEIFEELGGKVHAIEDLA